MNQKSCTLSNPEAMKIICLLVLTIFFILGFVTGVAVSPYCERTVVVLDRAEWREPSKLETEKPLSFTF